MRCLHLALATSMAITFAHAEPGKLSKDLSAMRGSGTVDVIVQFKNPPGEPQRQRMTRNGGRLKTDLGTIRASHYSVPRSALEALARDPDVAYVTLDRPVTATLDYSTLASAVDVAQRSPYSLDGTGIGIAVLDSGVEDYEDLDHRVVFSQSFIGDTKDAYGHGTHVAAIAAGNGKRSTGSGYSHMLKGVAPNARIVSLKVLDANGVGTDSAVIAAILRAIALKSTYNIRVMNLSLGRPVRESFRTDPLCLAVEAAWRAGIVVVVAAGNHGRETSQGNDGYATIDSPGNDPYVLTVGAMKTLSTTGRSDDLVASYSSKGPTAIDHIVKPDLVAAGNRVVSLYKPGMNLAKQSPGNIPAESYYKTGGSKDPSKFYFTLSGTSMATPVVSGAAALLLQRTPSLTPDQVKARLMKTAYKSFPATSTAIDPVTGVAYTSHYDAFTIGAGYLDVAAALANNDSFTGTALSPSASYDASTHTVHLSPTSISGTTPPAGYLAVWGDTALWSDIAIWGDFAVWSDTALWSDSSTTGFFSVWGDTALWSDSTQAGPDALSVSIQGEN